MAALPETASSSRVTSPQDRLILSYVLWALGWFGIHGLHRLYNGKIFTGLLWFFTFGLLYVGQFIDLFFVPKMAEEYRLKRLAKVGGTTGYQGATATVVEPKPDPRVTLLRAAQAHGGKLSVTQGVLATGLGFAQVETLLTEMMKSGYVDIENHPDSGIVLYRFLEL
ncbi:hypothetical protein XM38_029290 [Halomicronema hongdechloris C2206]|uniref:TM2 domain-containing protein n=1 Tax=Halomicronema hongdechloris C2206 TaxID=1641165 RepID=A0A1Z3HNV8_9CYAN|nr:NINE protein [Halomicronema hongdechloris]ASC71975.1 hypothetical protein XM38_029290 [Halomicronema hongdechloris C2206]